MQKVKLRKEMDLYYGTNGTNSSLRNQDDWEEKWYFQLWVIILLFKTFFFKLRLPSEIF